MDNVDDVEEVMTAIESIDPEQWILELLKAGALAQWGGDPDVTMSSASYKDGRVVSFSIGDWFVIERIQTDIWYLMIGTLQANLIRHGDGCVTILAPKGRVSRTSEDFSI